MKTDADRIVDNIRIKLDELCVLFLNFLVDKPNGYDDFQKEFLKKMINSMYEVLKIREDLK